MNKKQRTELGYINECVHGRLSVNQLCDKLKVTRGGLGHRIIRLNKLKVKEYAKDE